MLLYHLYAIKDFDFTRLPCGLFPLSTVGSIFPHVHASSVVGTAVHTINLVNGKKNKKHLTNKNVSPEAEETLPKNSGCVFCSFHPLAALSMCLKRVIVLEMKHSN